MPPPLYAWNAGALRYIRLDTKRFVSFTDVRGALDKVIAGSEAQMRAVTQRLYDGEISVAAWRAEMREHIKTLHTMSAAAGRGGWAAMTPADWGSVGSEIAFQYRRLENFTEDIASGKYGNPPDGRLLVRADLYARAGRGTFADGVQRNARQLGFREERNVLGVADHCDGCLGETARGWVPLGELIPIGERDCMTNCRCRIEYRAGRPNAAGDDTAYGL